MVRLPEHIVLCIEKLEKAGFASYAVGGCVRDGYLGIVPHDFDLCTSALPEQTEAVFSESVCLTEGKRHGTVRVVVGGKEVEITTFRKEGAYTDSRHPDWVTFVEDVEEDLARRDFTINAMAWSPVQGYVDPFGGRLDLENKQLRTVGDPEIRFREDPLRILRGVRFACRFGLEVEPETAKAMNELVPLLDRLSRERIWEEMCRILPEVTARDLLRFSPVFTAAIPELGPMVGFDQRSPHHAFDLYTHTAMVTERVPGQLPLRWAALLHDVGKIPTFTQDAIGRGHFYGHAEVGAEMAETILCGLHAPAQLRRQVKILIENHMTRITPDRKQLRRMISQLGWEAVEQSWMLQEADMRSKGKASLQTEERLAKVSETLKQIRRDGDCLSVRELAVDGHTLQIQGISGKEIGRWLHQLLDMVMQEQLPNDREALLQFVREHPTPKEG